MLVRYPSGYDGWLLMCDFGHLISNFVNHLPFSNLLLTNDNSIHSKNNTFFYLTWNWNRRHSPTLKESLVSWRHKEICYYNVVSWLAMWSSVACCCPVGKIPEAEIWWKRKEVVYSKATQFWKNGWLLPQSPFSPKTLREKSCYSLPDRPQAVPGDPSPIQKYHPLGNTGG